MSLKKLAAALLCAALLAPQAQAAVDTGSPLLSTPLPGIDGKAHRVDDWTGAVRIVNFWATWCAPCRSELPLLSTTHQQWKGKGVEVIGIAVDGDEDVRNFIAQAQVAYPMLVAEKQGQALMRANGNAHASLPYTLLLDAQGRILQRHAGVLDARLLRDWLAQAANH
jgi:thiol-disulfide isomerase/thioredoxin